MSARDCDCRDDAAEACAPEDTSPDPHVNRPGLDALAYRRGTWTSTLRRLKAELNAPGASERLNTHAPDDSAVALLDAFSAVSDVLTFYQERIANEGFLRTATERYSVLALADAVGYRPSPGVAASVELVFTVDDAEKAPGVSKVPAGTQLLHIPAQDETPQTFETGEALTADKGWNALTVPVERSQVVTESAAGGELWLDGITTGLRRGSRLLLIYKEGRGGSGGPPKAWRLHQLTAVTVLPTLKRTHVTWSAAQSVGTPPEALPAASPAVYAPRLTTALFGWNAPDWHSLPETLQKTYLDANARKKGAPQGGWPLFNAIPSLAGIGDDATWVTDQEAVIDLAQEHPDIEVGARVVVLDASGTRPAEVGERLAQVYTIKAAGRVYRQTWRLTGNITRLQLSHGETLEAFGLRESVVYTATDGLTLSLIPDTSTVGPDSLAVEGDVSSLPRDRRVLVKARAVAGGEPRYEAAVVATASYDAGTGLTTLSFKAGEGLSQAVQREGLVVYANVVGATHGKSVADAALGSGDGAAPFQRFPLKSALEPLTYVSDPSAPGGVASTLSVRVNGIAWREAGSLLDLSERDRRYVVAIADDGEATVTFGDGRAGARLPTGQENVRATWRVGLGEAGNVASESVSLMIQKPLGMRSVTNPEAANGGENPETLEDARRAAPASVLLLERVVSLTDYEDYARGFPGVGKASTSTLWDGERQLIHVTITDTRGGAVDVDSALFENLDRALRLWGDAQAPLVVDTLDAAVAGGAPAPRRFGLKARLLVDGDYLREKVVEAARGRLRADFGVGARSLGQQVTSAEVVASLHEVSGVIAVDLDQLYLTADGSGLRSCLPAYPARVERGSGALRPAELLLLSEDDELVDLNEEMEP